MVEKKKDNESVSVVHIEGTDEQVRNLVHSLTKLKLVEVTKRRENYTARAVDLRPQHINRLEALTVSDLGYGVRCLGKTAKGLRCKLEVDTSYTNKRHQDSIRAHGMCMHHRLDK